MASRVLSSPCSLRSARTIFSQPSRAKETAVAWPMPSTISRYVYMYERCDGMGGRVRTTACSGDEGDSWEERHCRRSVTRLWVRLYGVFTECYVVWYADRRRPGVTSCWPLRSTTSFKLLNVPVLSSGVLCYSIRLLDKSMSPECMADAVSHTKATPHSYFHEGSCERPRQQSAHQQEEKTPASWDYFLHHIRNLPS